MYVHGKLKKRGGNSVPRASVRKCAIIMDISTLSTASELQNGKHT